MEAGFKSTMLEAAEQGLADAPRQAAADSYYSEQPRARWQPHHCCAHLYIVIPTPSPEICGQRTQFHTRVSAHPPTLRFPGTCGRDWHFI